MEKKLINILDLLEKLLKWKKLLIINFIILAIVSVVFSLMVPRWFRSSCTVLSPEGDMGGMNIASMITDALPVGGLLGGGASEEATRFLAIINSRTMMEDVANQFDLQNRFKTKNIELTVKALRKRIAADINEDGTITISSMTKTPFLMSKENDDEARKLAHQMTSYLVKKLDQLNIELNGEKATNSRAFIEKRYLQNLSDLNQAEEKLKAFQKETGVIALEEQTLATINTIAELRGKIIAQEIEVEVLNNYVGKNHIDYKRAKSTLDALYEKYGELKNQNPDIMQTQKDVLITVDQLPDLGMEYLRLFRDVKMQETIMEFILPQYEHAKIQEQKEIPTLQILDEANLPIKKAKPKRAFLVLFVVFFGMVLSLVFIFFTEQINEYRENNSPAYSQLLRIKKMIF